jgi:DNA-binding CsgD family transcriptional regulator
MDDLSSVDSTQLKDSDNAGLFGLIAAIGDDRFGRELLSFLYTMCGAEHCAIFHFTSDQPTEIASASLDRTDLARRQISLYLDREYWRFDPGAAEARRMIGQESSCLIRQDISDLPNYNFRDVVYGRAHIRERLLLCRSGKNSAIGLSILRPERRGSFTGTDIQKLSNTRDCLLAILAKHTDLITRRGRLTRMLTSLDDIQACIVGPPNDLAPREAQVCARILYGVSSLGIALDLGIGQETVMTYRKRAYQRLGIATQRELLLWYVARWTAACSGIYHEGPARLQ